jgi:hypothetical protein
MARSESFTNRPNTLSQTNPSHRISCLQSGGGPYIAMGTGVRTSKRRAAESCKESVRPKGGGALSAAR